MQPYPNPNYYQNYMQPQQQFYNQAAALQQYQQPSYMQQAAQRINGRVVQSADMITANDVPMDGSVAFFPTQDLSEIYAKSWDANGKIVTRLFKPVSDSYPSNTTQDTEKLKIEDFNTILDCISGKVDNVLIEIRKIIEQPKQNSRTKKETNTE